MQRAFTLVETMVAVFIFLIIMLGSFGLFKQFFSGTNQASIAANNIDQARAVESTFVNEIRNMNSGVDGSYPLGLAGDNQLTLYSSYDSGTTTVYRVRYYEVASSTLYKGVTAPSGSPLSYNAASEKVTAIQGNLNASNTIPLFSYYDGSYAGTSSPLTQPVNVNQVKFIKMNLVIFNNVEANGTSTFTVSAGSSIRNLKTNLGS